jgi:excinuclease ABC subunit C
VDGFIFHEFQNIYGVTVLIVRNGKLLGSRTFFLEECIKENIAEPFILQFYSKYMQYPEEIFIHFDKRDIENVDLELLEKTVSKISGKNVKIKNKNFQGLVKYGLNNGQLQTSIYKSKKSFSGYAYEKLKTLFKLNNIPNHIECIDISHLSGEFTVGASIVWKNGNFEKKSYKKYKIISAKNDDFKAIYEVFSRKAKKIISGDDEKADIYVIDGGIGQLNSAVRAFKDNNLNACFMSISKGRSIENFKYDTEYSIESLHIYGRTNPLKLRRNDKLLLFIQNLRDEAHRFVINYSRKLALKEMTSSPLLNIQGLGEKRLKELLLAFPDIHSNSNITYEDIVKNTHIPKNIAKRIVEFLKSDF